MTWFGNSAIHPYYSTTAGSEVCEDFAGVKFCVGYTVVYHATPLLNEQGEQVGTISQSGTIVGTNPVRIANAGTIDFANHDEIFYSDFADVSEPHGDPSHPDDQIEAAITGGVRGYRGVSGYIDFNDEAKPGMTEVLTCPSKPTPPQPKLNCMSHYIDTMTWFGNSAIHPYYSTTAGSEVCEDFAGVKFCVGYTVVYHATPLLNEQGEQVGTISQSGTIVGTNPVRIANAGTIDFANHDEIFYSDFADVSEPHGDPSHPDDQIEAAITGGVRGYRGASGYIDFNDEAKPGMTEVLSCLMVE